MKVDIIGSAREAAARAAALKVDLYSDTNSKPTKAMRMAMADAECGNEQALEDPTTNALQERVAELLGKEAAVFLPSGTMCNEIAYRVWCRQGDEILMDETGHGLLFETGGPAALSGLMINQIKGKNGIFSAEQLAAAIRPNGRHQPRSRLVNVENTANMGGGCVWPLKTIQEVCDVAHGRDLKTHMDGARLMNAVVASGIAASAFAETFDSVWIDFSKGLGCPIGGVLAGDADFIDEAFRVKHQFGGAMRQSGIVAAAGLYALDNHVARLAEDHDNARRLHAGLGQIPGIKLQNEVCETNLVFFEILPDSGLDAPEVHRLLMDRGIRIGAQSKTRMRAVVHLDVDRAGIDLALSAISEILR